MNFRRLMSSMALRHNGCILSISGIICFQYQISRNNVCVQMNDDDGTSVSQHTGRPSFVMNLYDQHQITLSCTLKSMLPYHIELFDSRLHKLSVSEREHNLVSLIFQSTGKHPPKQGSKTSLVLGNNY
uniref:Uncharacterized protein n=1 Tax=Micrurus paraensis TaxID=1970185 RepID=A0A2D4K9Q8_9SAUR